jgi:hypothetical protein
MVSGYGVKSSSVIKRLSIIANQDMTAYAGSHIPLKLGPRLCAKSDELKAPPVILPQPVAKFVPYGSIQPAQVFGEILIVQQTVA